MPDSGATSNPFTSPGASEAPAPVDDTTARPFARGDVRIDRGGPTLSKTLRRTVKDLGADANVTVEPTSRAGSLSVKDLNDLAAEFSGVPSNNPAVTALTIEDLNSIEAVFFDVKMNAAKAAREASASGAPDGAPIFDNWSCCCCTPCCSCAASDPSPFDD